MIFISIIQLVNSAQFLSIACLSFLSVTLAALSGPAPTTVKVPLASIYTLRFRILGGAGIVGGLETLVYTNNRGVEYG